MAIINNMMLIRDEKNRAVKDSLNKIKSSKNISAIIKKLNILLIT